MAQHRILRLPYVLEVVGISKSRLYVWMGSGLFPKPVKLGPRAVGWRSSEVQAWLVSREKAEIGHTTLEPTQQSHGR